MQREGRIWELDFVRGIAILGVVIYHLFYDLREMHNIPLGYSWDWIYNFAVIFIILSGISSTFSYNNLKRGISLGIIALFLTAITYIIYPNDFIQFGILHLIAFCIIIYHFILQKLNNMTIIFTGISTILLGLWLNTINSPIPNLYIFGLKNKYFQSLDYFPIFPWAGYFILGVYLARILYNNKKSLFSFKPKYIGGFTFIGRHTLFIYLVHQPIIIAILNLVFYKQLW